MKRTRPVLKSRLALPNALHKRQYAYGYTSCCLSLGLCYTFSKTFASHRVSPPWYLQHSIESTSVLGFSDNIREDVTFGTFGLLWCGVFVFYLARSTRPSQQGFVTATREISARVRKSKRPASRNISSHRFESASPGLGVECVAFDDEDTPVALSVARLGQHTFSTVVITTTLHLMLSSPLWIGV